ncbi:MAG: PilZ domain-containing protein [Candidatus Sulfotelmatobacter sp.]|jgi:hypothetical protein
MTTPPVGCERRIGQRFPFNVPVALREVSTDAEGLGFTQDLSSRGAFFFTDMALIEGAEIELTLKMPSEITLGKSMRVRCRGRVLRVIQAADNGWKPAAPSGLETSLLDADSLELTIIGSEGKREEEAKTEAGESPATLTPEATSTKIGVAVCLNGYEYLPSPEDSSAEYRRISALHSPSEIERNIVIIPESPSAAAH